MMMEETEPSEKRVLKRFFVEGTEYSCAAFARKSAPIFITSFTSKRPALP